MNAVMTVLALATAYWLYWCARIVIGGRDSFETSSYGVYWGLVVANIIHLIGISHVGVAISAAVRVLRLDRYRAIGRVAELVTLIALITAVINIALDVGRPDRFIVDTLLYGNWRAPMVWSMTVIALYLTATGVYLFLSLRADMWQLSKRYPGRRLQRILASGYEGTWEERGRHDRTLFWLALALLPIMVSVHSVYGLFFGLLASKPGWYNPLQAPYFVLGAIVSGFSAIIVVAAVLRAAFRWQNVLTDRIFRVFGAFLAFVVFLYLYFLVSEHLTAQYFPATTEKAVSDSLLTGRFAVAFWVTVVVGLVVPFGFLLAQAVHGPAVRLGLTAAAALMINVAMFFKRLLLILPAQYQPHLPLARPSQAYWPSHADIVIVLGSYAFAALLFLFVMRVIPVVELPAPSDAPPTITRGRRFTARRKVLMLSLVAGVSLVIWGIATRDSDYAPLKWMIGLMVLVALPLENCLIKDGHRTRGAEQKASLP